MSELSLAYPATDARNAILEAGLAIFAAHGFHGATMREIAQAAGVSQGLLHHHFVGKEGLWRVVGERITTDFMAYMTAEADPDLPGDAGVRAMLRAYLGYWKAHPAAFRFNLWRRLDGPAEERAARSQHITPHGVELFRRAQAAGAIRADLPPGLALILTGGAVQFWLHSQVEIRDALAESGDEELTDEAFLEHLVSLVRAAG